MSDILEKIKTYKLEEITARKAAHSLAKIETHARSQNPPLGFARALDIGVDPKNAKTNGFGLIGEIKKASPSKGLIRVGFDASNIARAYESGGASCLSVLTDTPSFFGQYSHLRDARAATSLPILRKDFMFDPYQIVESRVLGADCVLLILAALDDVLARELEQTALEWGMDVLIETHNEHEFERALSMQSKLVGINNRDLRTFETSLDTTARLAKLAPSDVMLVSESGFSTHADLERVAHHGVRRFLIGETLMRQQDVFQATQNILGLAK